MHCASLILQFYVSSVHETPCNCASPILQFYVGSVPEISDLCFASSSILRWFRTCDFCNCASPILRFFVGSVRLYYLYSSRTALRLLHSRFANSPILRWFGSLRLLTSALRQFFDSMLVSLSRSFLSLRCSANSSILCWFESVLRVSLILPFFR